MTSQEIQAIKQYIAKGERFQGGCGCMGPQAIYPEDGRTGIWGGAIGPSYPVCPCAMYDVEMVNDVCYRISKVPRELGVDYVAANIGPLGGPYTVDQYGAPGHQPCIPRGVDPAAVERAEWARSQTIQGRLEAFKAKKAEAK